MPPAFLAQLSVFGGLIVFHWQVRFFVLCPLLPSTLGTTPSCFLLADVDTGVCRCVDPVVTGVDTCVYRYMDPYGHRCGRTCVQGVDPVVTGVNAHVCRYIDPVVTGVAAVAWRCCHGPYLWWCALGCWTQTFPGHLPAQSQPSVSTGLFILMETREEEPPVPGPAPWAWALSIHLWEENSPSLMGEPVPEGVAFRRGFRRSYQARGQTGPFWALPPAQVTDEPSWDGEPESMASPLEPHHGLR